MRIGTKFKVEFIQVGNNACRAVGSRNSKIILSPDHAVGGDTLCGATLYDVIEPPKPTVKVEFIILDKEEILEAGDFIKLVGDGFVPVSRIHWSTNKVKDILAMYESGTEVIRLKT